MKIALDPTPFHHSHSLLELPGVVADLGFEYLEMSPHPDFIPFYNHPKADDATVRAFRRACDAAGVEICSVLPVLRWSGPDEDARESAVRYWKRAIEIAVDLGVPVMNSEFSGRPERAEESERAFFRSMEELLPIIEREGIDLRIEPHPDDFVEEGHAALRMIRALNSDHVGFLYCTPHTFHMQSDPLGIMRDAGPLLRQVHLADSFDHRRSSGLRYIVNPPGSTARVHQHLNMGDGDVDWAEVFTGLREIGFDGTLVSSVFAEEENAAESSRFQLGQIRERTAHWK